MARKPSIGFGDIGKGKRARICVDPCGRPGRCECKCPDCYDCADRHNDWFAQFVESEKRKGMLL